MLVRLADTWSEAWTLDRGGWREPRDWRRIFFLRIRSSRIQQQPGQNPGLLAFAKPPLKQQPVHPIKVASKGVTDKSEVKRNQQMQKMRERMFDRPGPWRCE